MNFDEYTDRRGTNSAKWDAMEKFSGVSPSDGIPMWVADMDFVAAPFLQDAVKHQMEIANYGYFVGLDTYQEATCWWMKNRHKWETDPDWVVTTYGLGNAIAIAIEAFSQPGDKIVTFTPVYHEFRRKIETSERVVVECELTATPDGYQLDIEAWDKQMTGDEKIALFCSPHNPAGRVWTKAEQREIADFCTRHDLLLISDEIHQDLVYSGSEHLPMHVAAPDIEDRLLVLTSASKTFNIAGLRTGQVIIPDAKLRHQFKDRINRLNMQPPLFGIALTRAAYSPEGAVWVDELVKYLDGNRKVFDERINAIPGLKSMPMQATYLSWVDFSGTGMDVAEVNNRITKSARITANQGPTFGKGGENFMRFNIGTQRSRIIEAMERMEAAFSDLQ